jgi:hypothetical protein
MQKAQATRVKTVAELRASEKDCMIADGQDCGTGEMVVFLC